MSLTDSNNRSIFDYRSVDLLITYGIFSKTGKHVLEIFNCHVVCLCRLVNGRKGHGVLSGTVITVSRITTLHELKNLHAAKYFLCKPPLTSRNESQMEVYDSNQFFIFQEKVILTLFGIGGGILPPLSIFFYKKKFSLAVGLAEFICEPNLV